MLPPASDSFKRLSAAGGERGPSHRAFVHCGTDDNASAAAEAAKRGIQQARAARPKPNAAAQPAPDGGGRGGGGRASTAKTVGSLPLAYVRPVTDRLPGGRGLQWRLPPAQTQASRTVAALRAGQSIYDCFARNYANRGPLTDEQRKAMFVAPRTGRRNRQRECWPECSGSSDDRKRS